MHVCPAIHTPHDDPRDDLGENICPENRTGRHSILAAAGPRSRKTALSSQCELADSPLCLGGRSVKALEAQIKLELLVPCE